MGDSLRRNILEDDVMEIITAGGLYLGSWVGRNFSHRTAKGSLLDALPAIYEEAFLPLIGVSEPWIEIRTEGVEIDNNFDNWDPPVFTACEDYIQIEARSLREFYDSKQENKCSLKFPTAPENLTIESVGRGSLAI